VIRVRFHGRGGHGVKTASRILGTAAFLAGYQCQDSPVYGAERRGAAVVAFTRINDEPILERGPINQPDLIVVADETLLYDAAAGVLAGQSSATALFVNSPAAEPLVQRFGIRPQAIAFDITGRTIQVLGRASALSAGLAAAARLVGIVPLARLEEAMREEFGHLNVGADDIDKNLQIAREVFAALPAVEFQGGAAEAASATAVVPLHDPVRGAPSVLHPGSSELKPTGDWRVERPVIDRDMCTRCGLCFVQCPDGAIALDAEGYPIVDYDHCKGCMICRQVCPVEAIARQPETRAW
jgi:pyruvate ferredoxin oxidoreductase gamma subunit